VVIDMSGLTAGGGDAQGDSFVGIEIIYGSYHDDTITGDDGDNVIRGGAGADAIAGGGGWDTADYANAAQAVAVDLATGLGTGGDAAGDSLTGIEALIGSNYDDSLRGDAGANDFEGGFGQDLLAGATGSDTYRFGFDSFDDTIIEVGDLADIDRVVFDADVRVADVSVVRLGDDLLLEIEHDDGFLIDTVTVKDHFLGGETGLERVVFADGMVWDRDDLDYLYRNDRFNAVDDLVRWADEDTPYAIAANLLTRNDTTTEDPGLTILSVRNGVNGTAVLQADGLVVFTGAQDFHGSAFFDYTVTDGRGRESTATAEVIIRPVNDAPTAADDGVFTGYEDTPFLIPFSAIFGNDGDVDGDSLTIIDLKPMIDAQGHDLYPDLFMMGSNGRATVTANGVLFAPNADHYGFAGFRYTVSDGHGRTATAQVELQIIGVNDAPRPVDDKLTTRMGEPVMVSVAQLIGNDVDPEGDAILFVDVGPGTHGAAVVETVTVNGVPTRMVVFTPAADFLGEATFTYTVTDDRGASATGSAKVTVIPLNDPPNAVDDNGFETIEDQVLIIDPASLLLNDTDPNGDPLVIDRLDLYPENGEVRWTADGKIAFDPRADYNGEASFDYWISDGRGGYDRATVRLFINPANDSPVVVDDVIDGLEDLPLFLSAFEAFANDGDPEGDVIYFDSFELMGVLENDFSARTVLSRDLGIVDFTPPAAGGAVVTLANGEALPEWLSFDAATWTLTGTPPAGVDGNLSLLLTATRADVATGAVLTVVRDVALTIPAPPEGAPPAPLSLVLDPNDLATTPAATVTATLANGDILPPWLHFDAETWTLEGLPPPYYVGRLDIVVTATEPNAGGVATYEFELVVDRLIELAGGDLDTDYAARPPVSLTIAAAILAAGPGAVVVATLADGSALPTWLTFDATTLTFSGDAPDHYVGELELKLVASWTDADTGLPAQSTATIELPVDPPITFGGGAVLVRNGDDIEIRTPEDFFGSLAIRYKAHDIKGAVSDDWAVAVVNVLPQREAPDAGQDSFSVNEDATLSLRLDALLANDQDEEGDPISFVSMTQPQHGRVDLVAEPVTFDLPESAHAGLAGANITYAATLANGGALPDWLTIDPATGALGGLPPLNFPGQVTVRVTANDGVATVVSDHLLVALVADHYRLVYTPDPQYSGRDSFSYTISDGRDGTDTTTVDLNVLPVNDPPVTQTDTFTTLEDTALAFTVADLLGNDSDVDGDPIRLVSLGQPAHGTITRDGDQILYTPNLNFVGVDTVTYTVTDDADGTTVGTIRITVTPDNDAPVTGIDTFSGFEDQPVIVTTAQLLANDGDPDGDAISFVGIQQVVPHGRAFLLPDGRISFTPDGDYVGEVRFAYQITDGRIVSPSDAALSGPQAAQYRNVVITFAAVNDAPVARADGGFETLEDTAIDIAVADLLANDSDIDGDAISVVAVGDPVNGTVTLENGIIRFTPRADYFGNGGFVYTLRDAAGAETTAFVSVDVTPANDLPIAVIDDGFAMLEDGVLLIDPATLLANDLDLDGDTIVFTGVSGFGAELTPEGMIRFTAGADYFGQASFHYTLSDGRGPDVRGTVIVEVQGVEDAPRPTADQIDGTEDQVLVIPILTLLGNDRDPDGQSLQLTGVSAIVGGTVALDGVGNVIFTPDADFNGAARFAYDVVDITGRTASTTVRLDIAGANDAPRVAAPLAPQVSAEDMAVSFPVPLGTFVDVEGDALTYAAALADGAPLPTWLSYDAANRRFVGTPPADFNGTIGLRLTASDGVLATDHLFDLIIAPVNDAPDAVAAIGSQQAIENQPLVFTVPGAAFFDRDGDRLTFSAALQSGDPLPAWLVFDGATGTFSGTPPYAAAGDLDIVVTATDGQATAQSGFRLAIADVDETPVVAHPLTAQSGVEDTAWSFVVPGDTFAALDGDPLTLSARLADGAPLPAWLAFDPATMAFAGTPPADFHGALDLTVVASDGRFVAESTFQLTIAAVNDAPRVASPIADQASNEDQAWSFVLPVGTFVDIEGDPLSLSASLADGGALPAWLVFDAGARRFSGQPPQDFEGIIDIRVTASDGVLVTPSTFRLSILPVNDTPVAVDDGGFTVTSGAVLTLPAGALLANDSDVDASALLTITAVSGAQRGTVALSGGAVVFTPQAGYAGPAAFSYTVSDGVGGTATANVSVTVLPVIVTGTSAADSLTGTANADLIDGAAGDDILTGLAGNDQLIGGLGADRMVGGLGDDIYVVDDAGDTIVESSNQGTDTVLASVSHGLAVNVERLTLTGGLDIDGTGNTLANVLIGNDGDNVLDGLGGADTLVGGLGDDTYVLDATSDVVTERAGEGTDTVRTGLNAYLLGANLENLVLTGVANLTAFGNAADNAITGNTGANRLDGGLGRDRLTGGAGNDTYLVDDLGDVVIELENEGVDLVQASVSYALADHVEQLTLTGSAAIDGTGNALANAIIGNLAANILDGGAGADTLTGGLGDDTYIVDDAGDRVVESSSSGGFDVIRASASFTMATNVERLILTGSAAINAVGNSAANEILGNDGDNRIDGGAGADAMTGGLGDDIYVVDNDGDVVTEAADGGFDTVSGARNIVLVQNIEALALTGTGGYAGTGNGLDNLLTGNAGANTLDGGAGADTLAGGLGNDTYVIDQAGDVVVEALNEGIDLVRSAVSYTLGANVERLTLTGAAAIDGTGNELANLITGNAAGNRLDGGIGADTMTGGLGDDLYIVDDGADIVTEAANGGTDTVLSSATYTLSTNVERLTLVGAGIINATGNTGANLLTGNAADNILDGKSGADTLVGGLGNDTYVIDQAGDVAIEAAGEGVDTVRSSTTYTLAENIENLSLTGSSNINGTGNLLDNSLVGNAGVNRLVGAEGMDILDGVGGNDILTGGADADVFVFRAGYGRDTITDLTLVGPGADLIQFSLGEAFDSFDEVMAVASQVGANMVFTIDAATVLTLQNTQMSALVASDFLFAA
jgi:Ca2+-binding RTX toxin-like protein